MQRINALTPSTAPAAAKTLLDAAHKKIGMLPNLYATLAHSPAALQAYLQQTEALTAGVLAPALREQLALVTAGVNGCDYCASAHTLLGKRAGLPAGEAASNLKGQSADTKTQAALDFASAILSSRGHVSDAQLQHVRAAGFNDAQIVEIVAHLAMNTFTNYLNNIAKTVIDFPHVSTATAHAA
ncbi:MAG TPA: peroxidase-related enzyme [Geobacterales bacterium]|nr:peroxidase-related enzyme [Geobacterales bacterium]